MSKKTSLDSKALRGDSTPQEEVEEHETKRQRRAPYQPWAKPKVSRGYKR